MLFALLLSSDRIRLFLFPEELQLSYEEVKITVVTANRKTKLGRSWAKTNTFPEIQQSFQRESSQCCFLSPFSKIKEERHKLSKRSLYQVNLSLAVDEEPKIIVG